MSMLCPSCDTKAGCIDSRRTASGIVRRRYRCWKCQGRFTTVEEVMLDGGPGRTLIPRAMQRYRAAILADLRERLGASLNEVLK